MSHRGTETDFEQTPIERFEALGCRCIAFKEALQANVLRFLDRY